MTDQNHTADAIPRRPLRRTGVVVSALGLGGHHLGDLQTVDEAIRLVHEAVDAGITFFDNCWDEPAGRDDHRRHGLRRRAPPEPARSRGFTPMTAPDMQALRDRCAVAAGDGRHESYKLSLRFDNPQARWAHGFPLDVTQKEVQEMLFKEAGGP